MKAAPLCASHAAAWHALHAAGPITVADFAEREGYCRSHAAGLLYALWDSGHADRRYAPRTGPGRLRWVYVATGDPPVERMTAERAVREVLAAGPVVGLAELARRAGYSENWTSQVQGRVTAETRPMVGHRAVYRLRDAP